MKNNRKKHVLIGIVLFILLLVNFIYIYSLHNKLSTYQHKKEIVGTYQLGESVDDPYYLVVSNENDKIDISFYQQFKEIKSFTLKNLDKKDIYKVNELDNVYLIFSLESVNVLYENNVYPMKQIDDIPNYINVKK